MKVVFSAVRSVDRGEIEADTFDVTEEGLKLYRAEEGAESVFEDKVLVGFIPHDRLDYILPEDD